MKIALALLVFLLFSFTKDSTLQEKHPFEDEILAFEKADREITHPKKLILFTGSSSIRLWKNLEGYFPGKKVLNRGFGGSGLEDLIYYKERVIFPYQPRQIIIYSGENDIAAGKTPEQVLASFKILLISIRKQLPRTPVAYISMKPSPSRADKLSQIRQANALIEQYLKTLKRTSYINVFDKMLDEQQQPRPQLFVLDNLHMNEQGYALWAETIEPYLK